MPNRVPRVLCFLWILSSWKSHILQSIPDPVSLTFCLVIFIWEFSLRMEWMSHINLSIWWGFSKWFCTGCHLKLWYQTCCYVQLAKKKSQCLAMFWGALVCLLILSQGLTVKPAGFKLSLYFSLASHLQLSWMLASTIPGSAFGKQTYLSYTLLHGSHHPLSNPTALIFSSTST